MIVLLYVKVYAPSDNRQEQTPIHSVIRPSGVAPMAFGQPHEMHGH